ncbi:MAG TPA: YebC/PmpR family DNA-binding transcriptional regulator [Candidatus Acidoferrum sp.]|nr:YebC/PmpR family DNA-binding transcriptional regulator [Candidatus Acidoferrum sp.]
MSGHSKWATTKRQKAVVDAKRGAVFTRLGNAIAVAARGGADPDMNFNLRLAVDKARAANMPMANIQRSIDRGSGKLGGAAIEETTYEAYGPGGAAFIVECVTDNKNRTFPEVRLAFTKNGGSMAEPGAVAFQFTREGMVRANFVEGDEDAAMLQAIDAGAKDAEVIEKNEIVVYTDAKELAAVRDDLKARGFGIEEAELTYIPNNMVEVTDSETARKLTNLMNMLEELDDVVNVHTNFEVKE